MLAYQDHQQENELVTWQKKTLEKLRLFKKCPSVTETYAAMRKILFQVELKTCKS